MLRRRFDVSADARAAENNSWPIWAASFMRPCRGSDRVARASTRAGHGDGAISLRRVCNGQGS